MTEHENRLRLETSPYLLQHRKNPVDWYPWGEAALARARTENKPIFLSVGYAACHWCHVMERESFESPAVAALLNEHFVSVKVDREERPDIDEIYMAATVALTGSGGWPMSVFLTPDQRPFFAGTYFPPDDRWGRPGFSTLLRRIAELWQTSGEKLAAEAEELTRHVRAHGELAGVGAVRREALSSAVADFARSFDATFGGFGSAPKFPPHQGLRLLLRAHENGDERALSMVRRTLDAMKDGGIYDQVGGGFARYSTDERWLVPHFEKMLYDNAQLALTYLEAFQVTADPEYRRITVETLDYVIREMQHEGGGYYSATDADSEGEEGKFFVFVPEEIDDILGKDEAESFCLHYDISVGGNWEGKNVLNTPQTVAKTAEDLGRDPSELALELAASRAKVYAARSERVPPLLDDKVLTAWNGLMIDAMAQGYRVLGDARYLASAERAADFILKDLARPDGGLFRTTRAGKAHIPAFLEDYAYLADALISLHEAAGNPRWLVEAERLAERILADFSSEDGAFFHTANDHEKLIARRREGHDGALPNANAVAARALSRLAFHLDRPAWLARAETALGAFGAFVERSPRAFASALIAADFLLAGPTELVLVGAPDADDTQALRAELARHYLPRHVLLHVSPATPNPSPLARDKTALDGRATLYVCENGACQSPLTDPSQLAAVLKRDRAERKTRVALNAGAASE